MYVLIGEKFGHYPYEDELMQYEIALFSTKELGEAYVEKSKLSTYKQIYYEGCKQFRKKSLLSGYCGAYVKRHFEPALKVNPEF